jgi:formylglycine-generating enzyme required for sulfatase activity
MIGPKSRRTGVALALAGIAAVAGVLAAQPPAGKKVAVLVGVTGYNHAGLPDLKYTANDVTELAALLKDGYEVTLLTSAAADPAHQPTAANIRRALTAALQGRTKRDTVLVALAGHGREPGDGTDSFFCPSDANPNVPGSMISLAGIYREMEASGVGVKLLLVDACRNDPTAGRDGATSIKLASVTRPRNGESGGMAALFSCAPGERAFETDKLGGGHGVFFHYVLEGLRGKAKNEDGDVTWDRLREYVKTRVPRDVPKVIPGASQHPNEFGDIIGEPPVLLALGNTGGPPPDVGRVEPRPGAETASRTLPGLKLVRIEAGTFPMGSPDSDKAAVAEEKPRHEVRITRPFLLGKYAVTRGQFRAFVEATGYKTEAESSGEGSIAIDQATGNGGMRKDCNWRSPGFTQGDDHPVVCVSWNDANRFCEWLGQKDGRKYRLPTEAEWEFACRAGTTTRFFTGDEPGSLKGYANVADASFKARFPNRTAFDFDDGYVFTSPVGSFKPNPWGLYDMTGNVWQWCEDGYGPKFYGASTHDDPIGKSNDSRRVLRGGSWIDDVLYCRVSRRDWGGAADRISVYGFRVALRLD